MAVAEAEVRAAVVLVGASVAAMVGRSEATLEATGKLG